MYVHTLLTVNSRLTVVVKSHWTYIPVRTGINLGNHMKTVEFFDAIRARYNLPSDYATAEKIGFTRQMISRYRGKDGEAFGDETALKVAELLNLDPAYVLACVHAERAKNLNVKTVWAQIAARLEKAPAALAAVIFSVLFSGGPDAGAQASTLHSQLAPTHISELTAYTSWQVTARLIARLLNLRCRQLARWVMQKPHHFDALAFFA